jgi:hypothetical protein
MRFDVDWRGSAEGFRLIEAAVKAFLGKYDQSSTHPAALKLRQLLKDLKVLEGNICRLRESISSLEFSLAVRNICHWEHAIAQQMLQALVYLKTGDDLGAKHEHELAAIYRAMPWTQGPNEGEVQFLEEYFRDIHRVSFYPFDAREIACRLHHAVLAAEMLREHPISQIGFQDQGTTKGQAVTPLNFIPVDPALLKVEEVMGVLATAHSRLMTMMTQRCLPELKMLMQN